MLLLQQFASKKHCHYVDQVTKSETFKDWMKKFLYNSATSPCNVPDVPIKSTLPKHEPGLIDKLLEMWKLIGPIHKVKSEIVSTGKSKGIITIVTPMTYRKRWPSLINKNQFALRMQEVEGQLKSNCPKCNMTTWLL